MKKLISIFFLFSFFLFQYGKILDYMECRITAALASKADCGCDTKLAAVQNNNDAAAPLHQHQLKNYTEEFFEDQLTTKFILPFSEELNYKIQPAGPLPAGYYNAIFQPPRV